MESLNEFGCELMWASKISDETNWVKCKRLNLTCLSHGCRTMVAENKWILFSRGTFFLLIDQNKQVVWISQLLWLSPCTVSILRGQRTTTGCLIAGESEWWSHNSLRTIPTAVQLCYCTHTLRHWHCHIMPYFSIHVCKCNGTLLSGNLPHEF